MFVMMGSINTYLNMEIQDGGHPRKFNFTYRPPNFNRQMLFNFFGVI